MIPDYLEVESTMPSNWTTGRWSSWVSQQHWPRLLSSRWRCGSWFLGWSWGWWCCWAPTSSYLASESVRSKFGPRTQIQSLVHHQLFAWLSDVLCFMCVCRKSQKPKMENPYESNLEGQTNSAYEVPHDEQTGFWVHRLGGKVSLIYSYRLLKNGEEETLLLMQLLSPVMNVLILYLRTVSYL